MSDKTPNYRQLYKGYEGKIKKNHYEDIDKKSGAEYVKWNTVPSNLVPKRGDQDE